ncbi:Uncharacterised protein [Mycobacteroides abscessus subsp. abscessus]|nr:Uncharacterised protein [Mycobacteroides abscessus subsp. abscessus]
MVHQCVASWIPPTSTYDHSWEPLVSMPREPARSMITAETTSANSFSNSASEEASEPLPMMNR